MEYEEKLLKCLVENYRKSKKDTGDNRINKRTQINPEKIYNKYNANDGDFEKITKLNHTVEGLSKKGFVTSEIERFGTQIKCIYLVDAKITVIEQYLYDQYGYISKDMQLQKMKSIVKQYQNVSLICKKECRILSKSIENRKIAKNIDELDNILKAIAFIEKNKEMLYIREVSMKVYGDSKFLENKTLKSVCTILKKYANESCCDTELMDEILLDYHILKEPQKLCVKGNMIMTVLGKTVDISGFSNGIEMTVSDFSNIESVKIRANRFMTIENRTAYLRYNDKDTVIFYLGGYANRYQRDFIKLIHQTNQDIDYIHFGDIDAGGLWIHHNLCEITGIVFQLFSMSAGELRNEKYKFCLQSLTENDKNRLKELKNMNMYMNVVNYMLENNVKLEQEIVSLSLMKSDEVDFAF
ncbi:Wadjet anti-phage system protein JetD domain-containing protein [Eubacterium barkeri]|uniref:Wadjet protein JetD C-terminal domain-containing protein n=1 Tax=Eubacterium barkeri TaxID=1528 RepID=A0A1H3ES02_EUBBA|nr:Wadjet anti-phage system protein JetD domain-containing protein [Eubacterium barkeri]SDX81420.1 hypothetical protein SAMN04488579_10821 [Eubacterium barkeri]